MIIGYALFRLDRTRMRITCLHEYLNMPDMADGTRDEHGTPAERTGLSMANWQRRGRVEPTTSPGTLSPLSRILVSDFG